jgi:nitrogen regulatory protein PII
MKMLVVVYNDAVDEVMIHAFKKAGVLGYTKWKEALGEGTETEPKLGTHCWPGKNNVLAVVVEDEAALKISETIRKLKSEYPQGGIRTFVLQVEETI